MKNYKISEQSINELLNFLGDKVNYSVGKQIENFILNKIEILDCKCKEPEEVKE